MTVGIAIIQRISEFLLGVVVTAITLFLFPNYYYRVESITIQNAIIGALYVWSLLYIVFIYPVIVSIACFIAFRAGIKSSRGLSVISSAIFCVETAFLALQIVGPPSASFWIFWAVLGVLFFVTNAKIFSSRPSFGRRS